MHAWGTWFSRPSVSTLAPLASASATAFSIKRPIAYKPSLDKYCMALAHKIKGGGGGKRLLLGFLFELKKNSCITLQAHVILFLKNKDQPRLHFYQYHRTWDVYLGTTHVSMLSLWSLLASALKVLPRSEVSLASGAAARIGGAAWRWRRTTRAGMQCIMHDQSCRLGTTIVRISDALLHIHALNVQRQCMDQSGGGKEN